MAFDIDMNKIIKDKTSILFICLDSLRYDVAVNQEQAGKLPNLSCEKSWEKRQAPGNFTYASHQAMFAGFLPVEENISQMKERQTLFFSENIGFGRKAPKGTYKFKGRTWVESLKEEGYTTICIGGLSFFDGRSDLGKVMPEFFMEHYWNPSFGPKVYDSTKNQIDKAIKVINSKDEDEPLIMYINISALHYPCNIYYDESKPDSIEAQGAALRYVDNQIGRLFEEFKKRNDTFVICTADHGTCFGEDGKWYHGFNHPNVNIVPYKHFMLRRKV